MRRAYLIWIWAATFLLPFPAWGRIRLGVSDWPGWVAWYVAKEKGYFAKHGAKVELGWFPNYSDSIQALAAGKLDANSQTLGDTLPAAARGVELRIVLVNDVSYGNDALIAGPKIEGIEDLKGKTVALEIYSVSHYVLASALHTKGLTLNDVRVVNLSAGDAAAAFLSGSVPAVVVWNPWILRIVKSGKGKVLFSSAQMKGLLPDCLVASESALQDAKKRSDFHGIPLAWYETVSFIQRHPQEAAKIMARVVGLNPEEYTSILSGTKFYAEKENLAAFSGKGPLALKAVASKIHAFLKKNGLIEGNLQVEKFIDPSLVLENSSRSKAKAP